MWTACDGCGVWMHQHYSYSVESSNKLLFFLSTVLFKLSSFPDEEEALVLATYLQAGE